MFSSRYYLHIDGYRRFLHRYFNYRCSSLFQIQNISFTNTTCKIQIHKNTNIFQIFTCILKCFKCARHFFFFFFFLIETMWFVESSITVWHTRPLGSEGPICRLIPPTFRLPGSFINLCMCRPIYNREHQPLVNDIY